MNPIKIVSCVSVYKLFSIFKCKEINNRILGIGEYVDYKLVADKSARVSLDTNLHSVTTSEKDIVVTMDFSGEELGSVNKVPKITLGTSYADVGAISVSSVIATLQMSDSNAAEG